MQPHSSRRREEQDRALAASATEAWFGRAPGAWPFLGHVVALQRRPLALLDSLPAHGDLVPTGLEKVLAGVVV